MHSMSLDYIHFFRELSDYVEMIIVNGGYPLLFLFTALEGLPLFGMLIPGHVAIVLAGFLAKIGYLNIYMVILVTTSGAVLGDYAGYTLGRKYGMKFIDRFRPYFFISDEHINKATALLGKHTGKAMIIGRFSPMTRAIMAFLVGCSNIHVKKFWIYNIIGALSWISASVFLGYIFGAGYKAVSGYFGKFVLASLIFIVLIVWGYRFVNRRFHIFKRFELFVLGLNLLSLYALAKTIEDAWAVHSFMANFDIRVNLFMESHVSPLMVKIASLVSNIGSVESLQILGVLFGIYLLSIKKIRSAYIVLSSIIFTGVAVGFMKEVFMRVRPDNQFVSLLTDPSFPSGHAAVASAFFVAITYLFVPKFQSWIKRELFIVLTVSLTILIGVSRIVLNVHWFSDVIAGWALGMFVSTGVILLIKYISVLLKKHTIA